jgi:hypothetical protein
VLRMLVRVGERMIEVRIGQAACVMSLRQGEKRSLAAGELEQRRATGVQMAFCTLPPFRQRVQT